jgi:hypothetical protein
MATQMRRRVIALSITWIAVCAAALFASAGSPAGENEAEAKRREAALKIPLDDNTPQRALQRYTLFCSFLLPKDAEAMFVADGRTEKLIALGMSVTEATRQYLYAATHKTFGAAEADRVLPRHLTLAVAGRCKVMGKGDSAVVTLPWGELVPMTRVDGHWRMVAADYGRLNHKSIDALIERHNHDATVYQETGGAVLAGRFKTADELIASLRARGITSDEPEAASAADDAPRHKD